MQSLLINEKIRDEWINKFAQFGRGAGGVWGSCCILTFVFLQELFEQK